MSNKFIGTMLSKHVKVVSMDKETAVADGFDGMATGIRKIVVEGNMGDVPHNSCVVCPFTGVTHTILLIVNGRKSVCLRCDGVGHVHRDCTVVSSPQNFRTFVRELRGEEATVRQGGETRWCRVDGRGGATSQGGHSAPVPDSGPG